MNKQLQPQVAGAPAEHCTVCLHRRRGDRPLGINAVFECSHVECPNRRQVTAAPSDRVPYPPPERA